MAFLTRRVKESRVKNLKNKLSKKILDLKSAAELYAKKCIK